MRADGSIPCHADPADRWGKYPFGADASPVCGIVKI
jgi:hypothetical protein